MTLQALPYVLLTGLFFGTTLIAVRFGIGQIEPLTFVGLRLTLASFCFLGVYLIAGRRRPWPTDWSLWRHGMVLGVVGTAIPMTAIVSALQFQSSGVTAILVTTGPALTVLMAHFFLADESLNLRKGAGVALALGGALLLALRGETGLPDVSRANPLGYGLVLAGLFCFSGMTIYTRKFMQKFDSFDVTGIQMFAAAVIVMPLSALVTGVDLAGVDWRGYLALAYSVVASTFFAFLLYFYVVRHFGATPAAMANYMVPVIGSIGGVLLLGEQVTAGMLLGMGIIIAGIALINSRRPVTGPPDAAQPQQAIKGERRE